MSSLPSHWVCLPLAEVTSSIANGFTHQNNPASGGMPISRIQTISTGEIDFELVGYAGLRLDDVTKYVLNPGDILFSHINSKEHVGKVAIYRDGMPTLIHGMNLLRIVANDKVLPAYLFWAFRTDAVRSQIWANTRHAVNQASINIRNLSTVEIPVPPLEEQNRIVEALDDHLSRLDKALADLNAGQELLKAATRSFLHKVLNGSGSTKKLSEVCSLITDGSHFSPKTLSQGHPYITVRDISGDEIDFVGCKYISGEAFAELEKNGCRPLPNDVLFSKDGTVGKVTVVSSDKPFVVLSSLAILRPDQEKVLPSFLKLSLKSPMVLENALGMKTGTAIRRVVLRNLKNLEIDVPPLEKQAQLVEYVDSQLQAFKGIGKALQSQVAMIGGLRRSLLNAAFTGQILEGK